MQRYVLCIGMIVFMARGAAAAPLFEMPKDVESRWATFENPRGEKGQGGLLNQGAKGNSFEAVQPAETKTLMDVSGSGVIHRMWFTLRENQNPAALRSYVLRFYWDASTKPAVEVPFGDFFGAIHGRPVPFESELFSNPEGRSFNCYIPMPFRRGARVTFTNDSAKELDQLVYEIDYSLEPVPSENTLYFHASWRRERWTELGKDFEILPRIEGQGRFLGAHIGILGHPDNRGWFGEGEVKMYLDGDTEHPTLCGTGTEDYIGTAYGQGEFHGRYQGSLIVNAEKRMYAFYRYHVPDPVYFHHDVRVTIQQMGGTQKKEVEKLLEKGVPVKPVTIHTNESKMIRLLEAGAAPDLKTQPEGWTNMYRRDDLCAVALFYLDKPENTLPPIAAVEKRTEAVAE